MFRFLKNFEKRFLGSLCRAGVTNNHSMSRFLPARVPHHSFPCDQVPRSFHVTRSLARKDELASKGLARFKFGNLVPFRQLEDFHYHCDRLPDGKNVLGVDVGDYIGCALYDPKQDNTGERTVGTFERKFFPEKLLEIIETNNVGGIIVGLTLDEQDWEMSNPKNRRFEHITSFVCEMDKDVRFKGIYFSFAEKCGSTVRAMKIQAYRKVKRDNWTLHPGTNIKKNKHLLKRLAAWIIMRNARRKDPTYRFKELVLENDDL